MLSLNEVHIIKGKKQQPKNVNIPMGSHFKNQS